LSVPPRRKSVHMPKEGSITAERLYDYLERYNILLIDFRPREDFDHGHIFARNVICIDPLIMQPGLSAEQLSDKLVLSPESEQDLFYKRDSFELVVFYDSSTGSEGFLIRPQTELEMKLKQLHEALYDFNQDRPLQRPPIFLIGGIQAWIDLMGTQALQTSDTLTRVKPGRQIQRRPLRSDGPVQVPKRRVREYDPLDADEERKWRDRAISESVPSAPVALPDDTQDDESSDQQGDEPDKYPSIEDFNARFPDANQLSPSLPLYDRPTEMTNHAVRIPTYPSRPPLSTLPQAPMRPAPAAPRMSYTGVSERSVSQTTLVPRTNSGLTPYVPSKYLASNLRLPRTGLYNFGSTCYMNATLQALSATTPLSIMFLDDGFKSAVQKDNWKGSSGLLPEIYSNVIRNMWNGESSYIKPSTFRSFCARLNKTFSDPHQQQDAHEFFSFLVDCLHEDFNGVWSRSPLRPLTLQEEAKRERMPKMVVARMEWNRWAHRDNSYISSLLYGQSSSRLRCPECGTTSTQYDAWAGLQVEIPECREARLQDCLRAHFRDELLDDGNQWTCPSCKKPRRASKKLTITRLPPYLAITLGRFRTEGSSQRKVHTQVRFPLTGLDLAEFLVQPPSSPAEVQQIMAAYGPESLKPPDTAQVPPFIYDAYAVVQHHGQSTRSGHYTCAAKDPARGCWRLFNDTGAKDFDPHSSSASASHGGEGHALDNDLAYMIFYQRRRVTGTTSDSAANGRGERQ
jgi:ubiquitin carboxyl-terminal hydrolase 8